MCRKHSSEAAKGLLTMIRKWRFCLCVWVSSNDTKTKPNLPFLLSSRFRASYREIPLNQPLPSQPSPAESSILFVLHVQPFPFSNMYYGRNPPRGRVHFIFVRVGPHRDAVYSADGRNAKIVTTLLIWVRRYVYPCVQLVSMGTCMYI